MGQRFGVGLIPALIKRRGKQKRADGPEDVLRGRRVLREIVAVAEPLDVEVEIDGEALKGNLLGVEILTGPFTGPALPFAHDADPSDKLLDIICIETRKADALAAWIKAPQDKRPPVICRQGRKIKIRRRDAEGRIDDKVIAAQIFVFEAIYRNKLERSDIVHTPLLRRAVQRSLHAPV